MFRRDALDRDFDEELAAHVEMATEEYVRQGLAPAEARRRALARLGGLESPKQLHRDARGLPWLEGLLFDLRLSLRGLRRDWTFTLATTAMLALALGLNATIFTVMDAMLFRGFPYVKDNGRLVYLQEHYRINSCCVSYADFEDWRAQARSLEALAFVGSGRAVPLRDDIGPPLDLPVFKVSANLFGMLGVPPLVGRDFVAADEAPGAPRVAIITYRFWESRYAMRQDIVGLAVEIDHVPATIVGVMPDGFDFPNRKDIWIPVTRSPELLRRGPTPDGFVVVGRLREGVTLPEARAELETINLRLETAYPETNRGLFPAAMDYSHWVSGADATMIWGSLWVGAWFVLLIACANAANLTLVRTIGRWREFATRLALGAGQARMIRQMLLESAVVVGLAAAIAWWITVWCMERWATMTYSMYQVVSYRVTVGHFGYLVLVAIVTAVLLSLAPIVRVIQLGASGALKGDARGVTHGLRAKHLAAGLVAGQMALAVVLLAGAGVLVRSFQAIVGSETGVPDPANVLVGQVRLPSVSYPEPRERRAYFDRLEARLQAIPGIVDATVTSAAPMKASRSGPVEIGGRPTPVDAEEPVQFIAAGPDYFRLLGIGPSSGRVFTLADHASSQPVAIVNESFAARYWPGESAVGKGLRATNPDAPDGWRAVVGVVPNIMHGDALRQHFKPLIYVPFQQEAPALGAYFLVRPIAPGPEITSRVRDEAHAVNPDASLGTFATLKASFAFDRDYMDMDHSELGKYSTVAPVFAAIALLLAAVGLAAVIAHSVSQRQKEIGVRMAIGAAARDIGRMILREGLRPVAMGLVFGLAGSLGVNRVLQSQLVGVSPYDPLTMTAAPVVLIVVAVAACRIPARRAMRVDPVVALRHE